MNDGAAPTYQFVDELGIKQTDLRVAFGQIGYTTGNPFGVIAYATAPQGFLPWATFPSTNPIRTDQGSDLIAITPMINGYGWSSLNSGVCPNTTVNSPDTTRINATLRSTPGGSYQRAIADSYANTEPDAIVQIIEETAQICSLVPTNGWCKRVEEYAQTNSTGSALLDELSSGLLTEQSPVVGDGSVVTYTLTLSNPTNTRSRTMYAIVQTYGGIWLTEGNSTGAAPMAIIGGGTYDYHSISDPTLRDYHLIRINPIAANSSSTLSFRGSIDPNKAQSSSSDRTKTTTIAKVEVRITDDATATATTDSPGLTAGVPTPLSMDFVEAATCRASGASLYWETPAWDHAHRGVYGVLLGINHGSVRRSAVSPSDSVLGGKLPFST
jgi:hypothetical protein